MVRAWRPLLPGCSAPGALAAKGMRGLGEWCAIAIAAQGWSLRMSGTQHPRRTAPCSALRVLADQQCHCQENDEEQEAAQEAADGRHQLNAAPCPYQGIASGMSLSLFLGSVAMLPATCTILRCSTAKVLPNGAAWLCLNQLLLSLESSLLGPYSAPLRPWRQVRPTPETHPVRCVCQISHLCRS